MSITGIGTGYQEPSPLDNQTSSNSNVEELGLNQFLMLLTTQLQHQDPLSPLDSADFTAQLAQFAGVEQMVGMNTKLADIQGMLNSRDQQRDLVGLIGKSIKADDNTILVENGKVLSGSYRLEDGADAVATVYDGTGRKVRTLYFDGRSQGVHEVEWDGRDDNGNRLADGTYTFEVSALGVDGGYATADTYVSGKVTGVTYKSGQPYLMIADRLIRPDDTIVEISAPSDDTNTAIGEPVDAQEN